MKKLKKQAFTLMEMLVVVIIIGVLVRIAFPEFARSREQAMDREAFTILMVIRAAERDYKRGTGIYYPSSPVSSVTQINQGLYLDLVDDGRWSYYIETLNGGQEFTAILNRTGAGYDREWTITESDNEPSCVYNSGPNWCP